LSQTVDNEQHRAWLLALPNLTGSEDTLEKASQLFADAPAKLLSAIADLQQLVATLRQRYPDANLYLDLCECIGYHYHSGIVFGAYCEGYGEAIASGGRYDDIGEVYGRTRAATGFAVDLTALCRVAEADLVAREGIFVADSLQSAFWPELQRMRADGERVVLGVHAQRAPEDHQQCDRMAHEENGQLVIKPLV
jgi:ATP phosphoribosyltransferase regulatory subunit